MLEIHPVTYKLRCAAIDTLHAGQGEILLTFFGRTYGSLHHIAALERVLLKLLLADEHIVGRRHIVIVAGTEETVAFRHYLQHAGGLYEVSKVIGCILDLLHAVVFVLLTLTLGLVRLIRYLLTRLCYDHGSHLDILRLVLFLGRLLTIAVTLLTRHETAA